VRRVYLPASRDAVVRLAEGLPWQPTAVLTPADPQDPDDDEEEREFAAFLAAAQRSLALLPPTQRRRVVVSADLAEGEVEVTLAQVAAWHVDDAQGAAVVAQVQAGGPPWLLEHVALLWYAPDEVEAVLAELG
jgi:hypothetical protein